MSNFRDLLREVRSQIAETTPEEVEARRAAGERFRLLDVREQDETQHGVVPGAVPLSRAHFESRVEDVLPDKSAEVVVYCASGVRSAFAARTLTELGYEKVSSMKGGFVRWKDLGYETAIPRALDAGQRDRYSRHLTLPEVGEPGQMAFLESKVLCIGAGGLGSPALLYLAAAGVGTIGIAEFDEVDESNLQRQVIHGQSDIGKSKAQSAKESIAETNPYVEVILHEERLDNDNVLQVFEGYDLIVDGTDNFATRYMVNDAAYFLKIPYVWGSIYRFDGQASVFAPTLAED